jgi:hypothetical protein
MFRLPVEADEAGDQKFGAVFGGFRESLVEQEGVSNGAVDHAVEDVRERFALWSQGVSMEGGLLVKLSRREMKSSRLDSSGYRVRMEGYMIPRCGRGVRAT